MSEIEAVDLLDNVWKGSAGENNFHYKIIEQRFLERVSVPEINLEEEIRLSTSDAERVKVIKKYFKWIPVDQDQLQHYSKASKLSSQLRERANVEYKRRDLKAALRGYNLAILFGPIEDPETTLSYGNRSAVLLELHQPVDALQDIDLVLNVSQYPQNLHNKLKERKTKCEAMILRLDKPKVVDSQELFSLKSPNEEITCAEEFIRIEFSPDCGRKLVVTQNIQAGTVLLVEKPYITVLVKGLSWDTEHCHFCFKRIWNGIPCSGCTFAMFCSTTCKATAAQGFHQYEHGLYPYLNAHKMSEWDQLTTRLVCTTGPVTLYNYFRASTPVSSDANTGSYASKYFQMYGLISHKDALSFQENVGNVFKSLVLVRLLKDFSNFFSELHLAEPEEEEFTDFVASLLLHHLENIPYNAISFSELLQPTISEPFATGVFPTLSLVNHSCSPNAIHVKRPKFCETSLISLKPLRPGEEVCISYGPISSVKERLERRRELKHKYNFICRCSACVQDSELSEVLDLSCANCPGRGRCGACMETAMQLHSQIEKYEGLLHEAHELLKSGSFGKAIEIVKPCLDFFGTRLSPSYELMNVAQELFKKAVVNLVATY